MTMLLEKWLGAATVLALCSAVACGDGPRISPSSDCDGEGGIGCVCQRDADCQAGVRCSAGVCAGSDGAMPALRPAVRGDTASARPADAGMIADASTLTDGGSGPDADSEVSDASHDAGHDSTVADATDSGTSTLPSGPCSDNAGSFICEGDLLRECGAAGEVVSSETCDSERLCQQGASVGQCPICEPGTFRCQQAQLQVCAPDGLSFQDDETCETAALCNAQVGACTDATCLATTRTCEGDRLMRCNSDQDGFELAETCGSGLCDAAAGECDVCFANAPECHSGSRRVCNASGQGYTAAPCAGGEPICTGSGSCVQCSSDANCTQPQNPCRQARCQSGTCVTSNRSQGTACGGDSVCDGAGNCVECNFNSDCDGGFCSGQSCVECLSDANCSAGSCQTASCTGGSCSVSPTDGNSCGSGMVCNSGSCQTACGNGRVDTGIVPAEQCDPTANPFTWYTCDPATCRSRTYYTVCSVDENCDANCLNESNAHAYMCAPACQGSGPSTCPSFPGQSSRTDDGSPNSWLECINGDCVIYCRAECFPDGSCDWEGAECPPQLECTQVFSDVGICARP